LGKIFFNEEQALIDIQALVAESGRGAARWDRRPRQGERALR
jgi:hypothetical protein